jgi:hypothetical protein
MLNVSSSSTNRLFAFLWLTRKVANQVYGRTPTILHRSQSTKPLPSLGESTLDTCSLAQYVRYNNRLLASTGTPLPRPDDYQVSEPTFVQLTTPSETPYQFLVAFGMVA